MEVGDDCMEFLKNLHIQGRLFSVYRGRFDAAG